MKVLAVEDKIVIVVVGLYNSVSIVLFEVLLPGSDNVKY